MPEPSFMICLLDGARVPADEAGACPTCGGEMVAESIVRGALDAPTAVDTRRAICFCGRPFEGRRCATCGLTIVRDAPIDATAVGSEAASDPRRRVGKFVLMEKIGEGGMGEVWRAWQSDLGRWAAVKLMKEDDPELLSRFVRESQAAAKISHPNPSTRCARSGQAPQRIHPERGAEGAESKDRDGVRGGADAASAAADGARGGRGDP